VTGGTFFCVLPLVLSLSVVPCRDRSKPLIPSLACRLVHLEVRSLLLTCALVALFAYFAFVATTPVSAPSGKGLKAGDKVSFINSFTGQECSIASQCNDVFDPQPLFPGKLACCSFGSEQEVWTVEGGNGDDLRFKSKDDEYLCAINDAKNGIWQGNMDPSLTHGFYLVTKTDLESGCSYSAETVESGEVALRSRCGEGKGRYVGINTAGFSGKNGEIPMCAVWDSVVNSGHTYKVLYS